MEKIDIVICLKKQTKMKEIPKNYRDSKKLKRKS